MKKFIYNGVEVCTITEAAKELKTYRQKIYYNIGKRDIKTIDINGVKHIICETLPKSL